MNRKKIFISVAMALGLAQNPTLAQFDPTFELSDLNGHNGFTIDGVTIFDFSGYSVSTAGDVNGDGIDDVIIGAKNADPNGNNNAGSSYVVFGSDAAFSSSINLTDLDGTNGFALNGVTANDYSGGSVSAAGDVNGDGIDDLIIGAYNTDPNSNIDAGSSYVVFGSASLGSSINLADLNGNNGFTINGIAANDRSGISVSAAGDINGDGIDDVIIGAYNADPNSNNNAGSSYVVFGSDAAFSGSINLADLNGTNGFALNGVAASDYSGYSVKAAGDINGDGIDDLIIGAIDADSGGNSFAGNSYVVFGSEAAFGSSTNLADLNGSNGFTINGVAASDNSGNSVSAAGDVNGDGIDDIIIGAKNADPNSNNNAGSSYVVFGSASLGSSINLADLNGTNGFTLNGVAASDYSGKSVSAAGDINGDGIDDLIIGAPASVGGDIAGSSYVVFGSDSGFTNAVNFADLNGQNGFTINGVAGGDNSGRTVSSAGDVNGDGVDDVIIGAFLASPGSGAFAGSSYVVFGQKIDLIYKDGFE